ncbi:MAG: macro domain-containing protein [Trueperaceae bacterium]
MNDGQGTTDRIDRNGITIRAVHGDIADQPDADAVVNAANPELTIGGGVAGALHRAAGPGLATEAVPLGPIRPSEAVTTGGHRLPNRYVIHVLGPVFGVDEPAEELLAACYRNVLHEAERHAARVVAVPAVSTGAYGYPFDDGARVAVRTVLDQLPELRTVREVRFVLYTPRETDRFQQVLAEVAATP